MDFLARSTVDFPDGFWGDIDKTVVNTVRNYLTGRKFLNLFGPLGAGTTSINIDNVDLGEEAYDGVVKTVGRRFVELPQLYEDFVLFWRDIEHNEKTGQPLDLSKVRSAAQAIAEKEDKLIFFGNEFLGLEGFFTSSGASKISRSDWNTGENAFMDVAQGLAMFRSKGLIGKYTLVMSPDLYVQLQRIVPGLGVMEVERINKLLDGNLYSSQVLGSDRAVLLCSEPQYMDLAIGKDIETGYLETKDFNHVFRIVETAAPRIKDENAIIIFE